MPISTPNRWSLNLRGLEWLEQELTAWREKALFLRGEDLQTAREYLAAVEAERDQRAGDYEAGIWETIKAGFKAPFEALGGSAGAGAPGVAGTAAEAAEKAAGGVASSLKRGYYIAAGALVLGVVLWVKFGRSR